MERTYAEILEEDFGWVFAETGADLVAALTEAIPECDFRPARSVMTLWLKEIQE
jgi:hypothetical protein